MIYIFGDSYADPNYKNQTDNFECWHEQLSKKFSVTNYGLTGTGPHYSFKKYYELLSNNNFKKNDIIIFFLSGTDRIHFPKTDPSQVNNIGWDFLNKKTYITDNYFDNIKKYYDLFINEINFFYLTMQEELCWWNMKNVSFLYCVSKFKMIKTIVFSVDRFHGLLDNINNDYFYYYPHSLSIISANEFEISEKYKFTKHEILDYRSNHLSEINHNILYKNIVNIIDNRYNDVEKFEENIIKFENTCKVVGNTNKRYIYE